MKTLKINSLLVILCIGFLFHQHAAAQNDVPNSVLGNGGAQISGSNNRIVATVGQPATGVMSGSNNRIRAGFWHIANFPTVSIDDVTIAEGNAGTVNAVFTVSLEFSNGQTVTVSYETEDGTAAVADGDYVSQTGTLTFPGGTTTQTITVAVNSDGLDELDETFFVNLSNPTNAIIFDAQAEGTIQNDDGPPSITIDDVIITEGNAGTTTNAVFTVSLSFASTQQVRVRYATAPGTATANNDYNTRSGTVTFPIGTTTRPISIVVNGDALTEPNEIFFVDLTNPTNGIIEDAQGLGTISDDDGGGPGTIVFNPTDDAYVNSSQPNANFGTANVLRLQAASPILRSYLKFNVTGVTGAIESARLRMRVNTTTTEAGSVFPVSNDFLGTSTPWTEGGLRYINAPSITGDPLHCLGNATNNQIVEFEVTAAITGNGTYSFGLTSPSTTAVPYSSKEGPVIPELVIQTSAMPPLAPTISSFSPNTGPEGTQVTITGSNFIGVTQVAFNGMATCRFNVDSDTQIRAIAPNGVTTGKISMIASGGTAISANDFIVLPPPIVLNPTDDAYVSSSQPTNNFGNAATLRLRNAATIFRSYLKFNVIGITGTIQSAKLRMRVNNTNSDGGSVFLVANEFQGTSTPWTETGLNYNNAPIISGSALSNAGSVTNGQIVEFEVTAAITSDGIYSFGMTITSTTAVNYRSKESTPKPELMIQLGVGSSAMAKAGGFANDLKKAESLEITAAVPEEFGLSQNYPNPFNPETEIRFALPQASRVVLKIFNLLGAEIRTLVDEQREAGYHRARWDGKDKHGNPVASGVYLYQLRAGDPSAGSEQGFSQVRKMSLIR